MKDFLHIMQLIPAWKLIVLMRIPLNNKTEKKLHQLFQAPQMMKMMKNEATNKGSNLFK